jgi:outer membrane protein OmpA-like peptidoglycan-associated protein
VITASVAQDAAYTAATSSQLTFTVRNPQTLTFAQPRGYGLAEGSATFAPTSSASLTVAFASSTTSVCTLSGFVATFVATGTCTLTASQAGNSTYAAAASVSRSFSVSNAASPATINNVSPSANHASGASITVDFTAGTANGATINGFTIRLNPQPSGTPIDAPCAASPCSVSGLTPSADYTVEVITNSTIGGQSFTSNSSAVPVSTPVVPAFFQVVPGTGPNWNNSKNFNLDTTYNGKISWTSQTSSICTVDSKGAVTAVSPGTCAILVQTTDATGAAGYSVLQMFTIPASIFSQDDPNTTPIVCGVSCPGPIKYEPVQRKTITGFTASGAPIMLGAKSGPSVQFAADSAKLTAATTAALDAFVSASRGHAGKVFATGFVMRAGAPRASEVKLANARAAAVAKYLQSKGIDCGIDYFGYGALFHSSAKGRPADRKVVLRWDTKK